MFAPQPDGSAVTFWGDAAKTAAELRERNQTDADAYLAFDKKVRAIASFLAYINVATPPDAKSPSLADAIMGLKLGKAFQDLGAEAGRETIRALPMAVADLVQEIFEDEALRGPLSTRGVLFTAMGPWAAGTASVFLNDSAGNDGGAAGDGRRSRGAARARSRPRSRRPPRRCGVTIRTGAEVDRGSAPRTGACVGVTLADGTEIDATAVVSAADPKRTLHLLRSRGARPARWSGARTTSAQPGATAKVNLALSGLPTFHGADDPERLKGRIVIGPSIDHVEKAKDAVKYGHLAEEPWLEATIPTLVDPSLAPEGKHVMSVLVEGAPRHLRDCDWDAERERLGDVTVKTLEQYAPGLGELVEAREVITTEDLETDVRPVRRARLPRRAGARSVLRVAAAGGGGALPVRRRRPVPGRLRRPPGRRRHGRSGCERRTRDPERPRQAVARPGSAQAGHGPMTASIPSWSEPGTA